MQAEIRLEDAVDRATWARQQFRVAQAEATEALETASRQRERAKAAVINAVQASGWNSEELGLPRGRWRTPPRNERTEMSVEHDYPPSRSSSVRSKSGASRCENIERRARHRLGPRPQVNGHCQSSVNQRSQSATPKIRRPIHSSPPPQQVSASSGRIGVEKGSKPGVTDRARSASPSRESSKPEEEVLCDDDLKKALSLVHELEDIQTQWNSMPDELRECLAQRFDVVRRLLPAEHG